MYIFPLDRRLLSWLSTAFQIYMYLIAVADPGEGPGGSGRLLIFRPN